MRLNGLFTQIFLVFALVMVVCVGVSGWFVLQFSGNIVTRKICDGDLNFAGRIAQEIEAEVASVKPTLTLLAQTPELRLMEAKNVSVGVDRVRKAFPEITSVYVADMEGKQIYQTDTGPLKNVSDMRSFQVAKGGDEFPSDIYLKPTTLEPMQTITLPIIDSGTVVGVLSADVSFGRIMRSFMGVSVGEDGNVIVIANDGRLIAHTYIEQVQGVDLSRLPVVKAVLAGEAGTIKGYTDELGREVLGTYMPISELGWGVLIQRPLANIYAEVGQLRTTIIWVVIASVLLVLPMGGLMSRQIARPIGQIVRASKRVAQGDLSTSVEVKSSNEVGLLAHSFNQMVMSLKEAKDERQQWGEDLAQSRNALRESEERFRQFFENEPAYCYIVSPEGIILDVNKAVVDILGYQKGQIVGESLQSVYAPESLPKMRQLLSEWQETGVLKDEEMGIVTKEGNRRIVLLSVDAIRDKDGNVLNILSVQRDITERKQAEEEKARLEEQYHQAQKVESIGRLAGGVAHDLNNLLTPILGYSEMLIDDLDPDDKRRESVGEILKAGFRARDLVRQLLAFSRKQTLEYRPVDLNIALSGFEKLLRRTIREDIEIEIIPSPDIRTIMADIGQIEQVIMNLAVNAQDAMTKGGHLIIETALADLDKKYAATHQDVKPGAHVMLAISDTGCGMDEEILPHIFEPFFSTKGKLGTGLGLATVYGIVKQHGANIWVHSEPGMGTTFKIYLPVSGEAHVEEKPSKKVSAGLGGSETILLVEDNEQVRNIGFAILKRQGYTVLVAERGIEALTVLESHDGPVDLLLTDVVMPGMNGRFLSAKVSEQQPGIKVLYMSGYTDNTIAHRGVLDKGSAFIQKPFTVQALAAKVREVLNA